MRNRLMIWLLLSALSTGAGAQELFDFRKSDSRLSSFENPDGVRGNGGKTNKGAKGNAFEVLSAGASRTLLDIDGQGTIRRIWLTIDQTPAKLRSLRLQCYWDKSSKPAVDVPLGDFFVFNSGRAVAFESALFSSGEGRSFLCFIPMPFRKGARVVLMNEGNEPAKLFYDIDFNYETVAATALYFHAYWNRQSKGQPGEDYTILPKVSGRGRFLGASAGLVTDSSYEKSWWGEGEVKMFIDEDRDHPTINGTGAEDYIGSAWGLGKFINSWSGCTVADDSTRQYCFYRWHIPDPIWFQSSIKVQVQQIGGWGRDDVRRLKAKGARLIPVSVDGPSGFRRLLDEPLSLEDPSFPEGWVNFYRIDDYSSVAYFYLDKPRSDLRSLPAPAVRLAGVH